SSASVAGGRVDGAVSNLGGIAREGVALSLDHGTRTERRARGYRGDSVAAGISDGARSIRSPEARARSAHAPSPSFTHASHDDPESTRGALLQVPGCSVRGCAAGQRSVAASSHGGQRLLHEAARRPRTGADDSRAKGSAHAELTQSRRNPTIDSGNSQCGGA